ncbi:MAG: TatD family hydrolase [Pseudomonadota bacterium]|nr:TatD family hydrolase [Pseudomonadota bacterium]
MLVDSHCHLDFESFKEDREECIERARSKGINTLLTISTHISRFDAVLKLAKSSTNLYCSVGIHPHHVSEEPRVFSQELIKLSEQSKVIGIGETGLDFYYDNSPREQQQESFLEHVKAARETQLPLIVHTRDADHTMAQILKKEMEYGPFPCVLHCFSSGKELADCAIKLGCYISISGIVTFKNAEDLRNIVYQLPLDRILVETDAPFLAPVPNRGKRNEPSFLINTVDQIAKVKGISSERLADITTQNFFHLFSKATRPCRSQ